MDYPIILYPPHAEDISQAQTAAFCERPLGFDGPLRVGDEDEHR